MVYAGFSMIVDCMVGLFEFVLLVRLERCGDEDEALLFEDDFDVAGGAGGIRAGAGGMNGCENDNMLACDWGLIAYSI